METVHESPTAAAAATATATAVVPSALEEERLRMQRNVQKATNNRTISSSSEDTVGAMPMPAPPPTARGVRRLKSSTGQLRGCGVPNRNAVARASSMRSGRGPLAPTKSMDAAASVRGNSVARANSSHALLRASSSNHARRGVPGVGRAVSNQGLRPYSRDQIVNTSIRGGGMTRKVSNDGLMGMMMMLQQQQQQPPYPHQRGPGGTLERHESDLSLGDGSLFTMDSVQLRKGQMVADPLEDGTYNDQDSFADHESFVTNATMDNGFADVNAAQHQPVLTFSDLEELRLTQRLQIGPADDASYMSFGTLASGLTTDFSDDQLLDESDFDALEGTEYNAE